MGHATRRVVLCLAALLTAPLLTPLSSAQTARHGDTVLRFSAAIAPTRLPRHRPVPISLDLHLHVEGGARHPPATRRIAIQINRGGRIERAGLPACDPRRIRGTSSRPALRACRPALIGRGSYLTETTYPEGAALISHGTILVFNAGSGGHPLILAHLYSAEPASNAHLLYFHLARAAAPPFGAVLSAALPAALSPNGSLLALALHLERTYRFRNRPHSYLSASCALPPNLDFASFPLARASLAFADRSELSATMQGACRVRR